MIGEDPFKYSIYHVISICITCNNNDLLAFGLTHTGKD